MKGAKKRRERKRERVTERLVEHIPVFVLACFTLLAMLALYLRAGAAALPPSIPMLLLLAVTVVDRFVSRAGRHRR